MQSSDLKAKLKELRGEAVRNTKQMNGLREQVVDVAIKSEVAMLDATINLKLRELRKLQESQAANRFQFANRLGPVMDLWKKLPAGKRRTAVIAGGIVLGFLLLVFLGRGMFSNGKGVQTAETAVDGRQSSKQGGNPSGNPQPKEFVNSIGMKLRLIPKGTFTMGSPTSEEGRSDDEKQHEVTLTNPFYIGKYEVTQEQWEAVMGDNPSDTKGATLPVTDVSWNECQEFIKKLNTSTNGNYRLPTEAEWEFACRAGTMTAYSFGDNITSKDANYNDSRTTIGRICKPVAVGSYMPNAFGLYDIHGNVFEWCEDKYEAYPAGAVTDPKGPATGTDCVLRGGSFLLNDSGARSSYRSSSSPSARYRYFGFRVAMTYTSDGSETVQPPSVSGPSTPPDRSDDSTSNTSSFRYMFNGKSYTGAIEQDNGIELVFYDPKDTLLSLTINKSTSTVVSSFLGVTKGRLHLGGGKENILLQLSFFLEGQPSKGPTRMLPTSRDELGDNSAKVRGSLVANYLRPGPSYKTHWFGKPASNVPKEDQEIVLRKGSSVLVGFGVPFKIQAETEVVRVQYAEFSPSGQLAMLKKFIGDPGLQFVIGDRTLQIDDSARRTLFLLERAVAVLRYRQGARDNASRPSMGD